MTVGELIDELRKHPVDAHVMTLVEDGFREDDVVELSERVNDQTKQKFVIIVASSFV